MIRYCSYKEVTHIFIFELLCQGLNLEPLSLIIVEGVIGIGGGSQTWTWRFILCLEQMLESEYQR